MSRRRRLGLLGAHLRKHRYRYIVGILAIVTAGVGASVYLGSDRAHVPNIPAIDPVISRLPSTASWCSVNRASDHCWLLQEIASGDATDTGSATALWPLSPEGGIAQGINVGGSELAIDAMNNSGDVIRYSTPDAPTIPLDSSRLVTVTFVASLEPADSAADDVFSHLQHLTGNTGYEVRVLNNGAFAVKVNNSGSGKVAQGNAGIANGNWHCVTVRADGRTANAAKVFVDGVDQTSAFDDLLDTMGWRAIDGKLAIGGSSHAPTASLMTDGPIARLRLDYTDTIDIDAHRQICGIPVVVQDYDELRLYTGGATIVEVVDSRTQGKFSTSTDCIVDNGMCLQGTGTRWLRQSNVYMAQFWELGEEGLPGQTVESERDAVDMASQAANANGGGTVLVTQIYEVDSKVRIFANVTFEGHGVGGLRRQCEVVTTLTASLDASDLCVQVADPSSFKPIDTVRIATGPGVLETLGDFRVNSVDATQLCSLTEIGFNATSGATAVRYFDLIGSPTTVTDDMTIQNMIFDGARSCNTSTHDWRYQNTANFRGDSTITGSTFREIPSENLTICGGTFTGNTAIGLNGSFVHKSCSGSPPPLDVIDNNTVDGVCEVSLAVNGHNEGAYTFSANAGNVTLTGNDWKNGGEATFGAAGTDDATVTATGNIFENFTKRITIVGGHPLPDSFDIDDNTWINVPDI